MRVTIATGDRGWPSSPIRSTIYFTRPAVTILKARLEARKIVMVAGTTIADGIAVTKPGEHTFLVIQTSPIGGSGGVGVATVLNGKIAGISGKRVCCVLTGGNIDTTFFLSTVLQRGLANDELLSSASSSPI